MEKISCKYSDEMFPKGVPLGLEVGSTLGLAKPIKTGGEGQGGRSKMPSPCCLQGQEEDPTLEIQNYFVNSRLFALVVHKNLMDLAPDS